MLNFTDMMQIAVLGFFTGLGSSMGTEMGKALLEKVRKTKQEAK